MRNITEYIENNTFDEQIDEGFLGNLLGKLGNFLVKKFNVSENGQKELNNNLNKENEALNAEISKVSKGKLKDLAQWWQAYIKENKNAAKAKSPLIYSQAILKNTGNVSITMKKMLDSYQSVGILNNTIICMFIKTVCNQYTFIIEAIVKDNSKKINIVHQLTGMAKLLGTVKIADNEDGEKHIKDAISGLEKNAQKIVSKYK